MNLRPLVAAALGVLAVFAACSSDVTPAALAEACTLNTDCNAPLICGLGRCHGACRATRDCTERNARCVRVSAAEADDAGITSVGVCESVDEVVAQCTYSSECPSPLKCAVDSKCRAACAGTADCLGAQSCVSNVCADTNEVDVRTGDLAHTNPAGGWNGAVDDAGIADGGVSYDASGYDGSSGTSDSGASSDGGGSADVLVSDGGPCSIRFSTVAIGDSNNSFSQGIGTRTADGLLFINSLGAPQTDGGPNVSWIGTQTFDLKGAVTSPAAGAFVTSGGGGGPVLLSAATAPDGTTMVTYYDNNWTLFGAFLTPTLAPLASPFVLQTSNAHYNHQVDLQWVYDRFVVTWVYGDGGLPAIGIAMFGTDGGQVAGISPVPTDDANGHVLSADGSTNAVVSMAASNNVIAIAYRSAATKGPMLTLLDLNATPSGNPVTISTTPSSYGLAVGGTNLGFAYVWYEGPGSAIDDAGALEPDGGLYGDKTGHATFISTTGVVGITTRLVGSTPADNVRGASDGTRAGFGMLFADGLRFGYATGDLTGGLRVAPAIAGGEDLFTITSFGNSFGLFLYSNGDHRTRGVAEGCNLVTSP